MGFNPQYYQALIFKLLGKMVLFKGNNIQNKPQIGLGEHVQIYTINFSEKLMTIWWKESWDEFFKLPSLFYTHSLP